MDESEMNLLIAVGGLVLMAIISFFALRYMIIMQRRYQKEREEREQFLMNFAGTLNTYDIERYNNLPSQSARINWLEENHPEFIALIPYTIVEFSTAKYLDSKLLKNDSVWSEKEMLQRYLERSENMSLKTYQEDLNAFARWIESQERNGLNRESESSKLWESLSSGDRESFKRERNPAERKKILATATPESTSTYEIDYLYPIILASYVNTAYSDGGGDVSYYDGSDFGGGDSGGDSGGGDGGGGGGD